jgi:hypothetical protein
MWLPNVIHRVPDCSTLAPSSHWIWRGLDESNPHLLVSKQVCEFPIDDRESIGGGAATHLTSAFASYSIF